MFTCIHCHSKFEVPLSVKVNQAAPGERPYYEKELCCPQCGVIDPVVVGNCHFCGKLVDSEDLTIMLDDKTDKPEWVCPECLKKEDD